MSLDASRFPLVFARDGEPSMSLITQQFEEIFDREAPFVLITDHRPDDHDDEPPEHRREKAMLFKQMKSRLKKYCLGMIVIEGDQPVTAVMKLAASGLSKALGMTVRFVPDEDEAIICARSLLETA